MTEDAKSSAPDVEEQVADKAENATQQEDGQERNFKALRESRDQERAEKERLAQELAALKAAAQGQSPKEKAPFDYLDGEDEDWMTKREAKAFKTDILTEIKRVSAQAKYPNAQELLQKYANEVPVSLANAIAASKDIEAAIEAVRMTPGYIRDHAKEHVNAAKAMDNAERPKSPIGVGTSAKVSGQTRYAQMTAAERLALQEQFIRASKE